MAQPKSDYKPTKRGGGGTLKLLWWEAPTLINPHFATGTKDQDASYLFYEPLAVWDADANLIPKLAAEIPSKANGGLSADGKSVTWKLKQGVKWHDGQPFSADDVVFNWKYATDPATAAVTSGVYKDINVEKIDDHTVRITFAKPTPFWADALRRQHRHDHPEAFVRAVYRREIAPGAGQPVAGWHRLLQVQGIPPRRHRHRRDQCRLPRAEPSVFRRRRDEGWRRSCLGRARRAADRRIRLCLEPAGRRQRAEAATKPAARDTSRSPRAPASSISSSTPPIRTRKSMASGPASRPSIPRSAIRTCARR